MKLKLIQNNYDLKDHKKKGKKEKYDRTSKNIPIEKKIKTKNTFFSFFLTILHFFLVITFTARSLNTGPI